MNSELLINDICHQGYHVIDDFLEGSHYQSLRTTAIQMHEEGLFRQARIGRNEEAQHNARIRTDLISWLDEDATDPAVQAYLAQIVQVANTLNQALFLGLFEFETHFAAYEPGSFYKKHKDQFLTTQNRKLSCVYYLNDQWHRDFGGELNLYSDENKLLHSVAPEGNRFICFNSELTHEVCMTHKARYSITGWMKTRV
jgi:SM-20-related protein